MRTEERRPRERREEPQATTQWCPKLTSEAGVRCSSGAAVLTGKGPPGSDRKRDRSDTPAAEGGSAAGPARARRYLDCHRDVADGGVSWLGVTNHTAAMTSVPEAVQGIVRRWREENAPSQPPMEWPRDRWIAQFPAHADALRNLSDRIDRVTVRRACQEAAVDASSAELAFIVVMAWGYGREVGYGPWRTHRVLTQTPDAAARLRLVAQTLAESGAVSAYQRLTVTTDCNLRWLGPAFGTKYLYFCERERHDSMALILDNLVATWLRREAATDLDPVPWSVATYRTYLDHMQPWSAAVGCDPDELEYCIFRAMATERSSQWGGAVSGTNSDLG
jgi:hypothetical protein